MQYHSFFLFVYFISFTNCQIENNWTWISGSDSVDQKGIYGLKGIANNTNIPGSRYGTSNWIDSNNNLWLFGGQGYDVYGFGKELNLIYYSILF